MIFWSYYAVPFLISLRYTEVEFSVTALSNSDTNRFIDS